MFYSLDIKLYGLLLAGLSASVWFLSESLTSNNLGRQPDNGLFVPLLRKVLPLLLPFVLLLLLLILCHTLIQPQLNTNKFVPFLTKTDILSSSLYFIDVIKPNLISIHSNHPFQLFTLGMHRWWPLAVIFIKDLQSQSVRYSFNKIYHCKLHKWRQNVMKSDRLRFYAQ